MSQAGQQMCLTCSSVAEDDDVGRAFQEASVPQGGKAGSCLGRQPFELVAAERLLVRQLRLFEESCDSATTALGRLHLRQSEQVLGMAQTFGFGSAGYRGVLT